MNRLTATQIHEQKVAELGLDSTALDLTSVEAIAGALRRCASFLCPCTRATLVRGVVRPLRGLVDHAQTIESQVDETLEAMIAHGDVLEHIDIFEDSGEINGALVYAAPPSFVLRQSGTAMLLGIASDQLSGLPEELEARIEHYNHLRRMNSLPNEDLCSELEQFGLIEISYATWLRSPPVESPEQHLLRLDGFLDLAEASRNIPGLSLLDPQSPVHSYRDRWVEPRSQTGRFVGRRSRTYGADLWCYVQLRNGNPERMVDLPVVGSQLRGCDEAWRLQLAIDALRSKPQRFRIRSLPGRMASLELFSPLPMWARRRWDAIGEPVPAAGCLFAYRLAEAELEEEKSFAQEALWLEELTGGAL